MRENVIIAYRGAHYEIGQWPHGYGIWSAGSTQSEPLEWWPATPDGWSAAWYRFAAVEVPGTIAPASTPADQFAAIPLAQPTAMTGQPTDSPSQPMTGRPTVPLGQGTAVAGQPTTPLGEPTPLSDRPATGGRHPRIAAGLLMLGVICGVASLFPAYLGGASLASEAANLVPHVIYLAAWAAGAVLILLGPARQRIGALLALGVSVVTFGLFFADAGQVIAGGGHLAGTGLVLAMIGWLACAAGSGLALGRWPADWPRRLRPREIALAVTLTVAALGIAITFAPSWDSFLLRFASAPSQTVTAGNAFANPAPVIAGDVAVMVALFAVVVAAALWRPARIGWALAAGAMVPMAAQAISALVQVSQPSASSPATLGISPSAARLAGLTISPGFTTVFWAYCAFLIVAIIACAWLATAREAADPHPGIAAYPGGMGYPGFAAAYPGTPAYSGAVAQVSSAGQATTPPAAEAPAGHPASQAGDDRADSAISDHSRLTATDS